MASGKPEIIVGIDIGQTCSGVAYSVGPDYHEPRCLNRWPALNGIVREDKVATRVGYRKGTNQLEKWGFECSIQDEQCDVREQFKLTLDSQYVDDRGFDRRQARQWYGDYLRCLHREIETFFDTTIPNWRNVLVEYNFSTPTTWKDPAMIGNLEKLIKSSGFAGPNQVVRMSLTEAEAAAIEAARNHYRVGDIFVICDAGGGTTDINVLKVKSTDVKMQLDPLDWVEGVSVGSTLIDFCMLKHICDRLKPIQQLLNADIHAVAESMLKGDFQVIKHSFPQPLVDEFSLPIHGLDGSQSYPQLGIRNSRLSIARKELSQIFDEQIDVVLNLMDERILNLLAEYPQEQVSYIILSGGFGSSPYLYERMRSRYEMNHGFSSRNTQSIRVMKAPEPQLAVVRGLVRERVQQIGVLSQLGSEVFSTRRCRNSYAVAARERYDPHKHTGLPVVTDPTDNQQWVEHVADWFLVRGQKVNTDYGVRRAYGSTLAEDELDKPRSARIFMSTLPPDELPQLTSDPRCKEVVNVTYRLTENDLKLKNRQIWKLGKKYWRAEMQFVVKLGAADLRFQILGKNGLISSDHDALQVEYLDPTDTVPVPEMNGRISVNKRHSSSNLLNMTEIHN